MYQHPSGWVPRRPSPGFYPAVPADDSPAAVRKPAPRVRVEKAQKAARLAAATARTAPQAAALPAPNPGRPGPQKPAAATRPEQVPAGAWPLIQAALDHAGMQDKFWASVDAVLDAEQQQPAKAKPPRSAKTTAKTTASRPSQGKNTVMRF